MNIDQFERFQTQAREANVLYYFNGDLNQTIMAALGEALRHRLEAHSVSGPARRKVFSTFVEMAQNVLYYGALEEDAPQETAAANKRASMALGCEGQHYWIVCGNLVEVAHIPRISERLNELRSLSLPEIKERYRNQVANDEHAREDTTSKGAGLGLLTIARDSKAPIEFSFASDPDSHGTKAFFIIKAVV